MESSPLPENVDNSESSKSCNISTESQDFLDICDDESLQNLLDEPKIDRTKLRTEIQYQGFDNNAGDSWIYPTNYPVRDYQYNITETALFKNTLVVLPTGLGKTFIAAVVMYNFYRWYPTGKVIFMAPTRPLVAQQIEACYQIMGIAKADTAEVTGQQNKTKRSDTWSTKRVFFITPHVLRNDLQDPDIQFPINDIKLIVIDEAHKAKGKYAYVTLMNEISQHNRTFRVLALSATPGAKICDVSEVVKNLMISTVEVRNEKSADVEPFTHHKNIKMILVQFDERIKSIRERLILIIDPFVRYLLDVGAIRGDVRNLSRGSIIMQQKAYISTFNAQQQARPRQHSDIMSNFSHLTSLYHSLELLDRHGVRIFLNFIDNNSNENQKFFVQTNYDLQDLISEVRDSIEPYQTSLPPPENDDDDDDDVENDNANINPNADVIIGNDFDFGHPKFEILRANLLEHFQQNENDDANAETRAIVFCEYRESVYLIHRMLQQNKPLIRAEMFVGKGGAKCVTQKKQIALMQDFRCGKCNLLIATCVAEEGIDVGEVDLIICFDISTSNPTRLVQRIGRTGRKRTGRVLMLVTPGREQKIMKQALATKDSTNRQINYSNEVANVLYRNPPRMVPTEFNPKCLKTFIKIKGVVPLVKNNAGSLSKLNGLAKNRELEHAKNNGDVASHTATSSSSTSTRPSIDQPTNKIGQIKNLNPQVRGIRQFFKPISSDKKDDNANDFQPTPKLNQSLNTFAMEYNIDYRGDINSEIPSSIMNETKQILSNDTNDKIEFLLNVVKDYRKSLDVTDRIQSLKIPTMHDVITCNQFPESLKHFAMKTDTNTPVIKSSIRQKFSKLFETEADSECLEIEPLEKCYHDKIEDTPPDDRLASHLSSNDSIEMKEVNCDNVYIDSQFQVPRFIENESKYQNQIVDSPQPNTSRYFQLMDLASSTPVIGGNNDIYKTPATPLKIDKTKAETPIKTKIVTPINKKGNTPIKTKVVTPIKSSPLAKAFERQLLQKSSLKQNFNNSLSYFGLNSIDDLFADDDDSDDNNAGDNVVAVDEPQPNTRNQDYSDMFADESVFEKIAFAPVCDISKLQISKRNSDSDSDNDVIPASQLSSKMADNRIFNRQTVDSKRNCERIDDDDEIIPCSQIDKHFTTKNNFTANNCFQKKQISSVIPENFINESLDLFADDSIFEQISMNEKFSKTPVPTKATNNLISNILPVSHATSAIIATTTNNNSKSKIAPVTIATNILKSNISPPSHATNAIIATTKNVDLKSNNSPVSTATATTTNTNNDLDSELTISQILSIVNADSSNSLSQKENQQPKNGSQNSIQNASISSTNNAFIGSIDELFGSDNEDVIDKPFIENEEPIVIDDDEEEDVIMPSQVVSLRPHNSKRFLKKTFLTPPPAKKMKVLAEQLKNAVDHQSMKINHKPVECPVEDEHLPSSTTSRIEFHSPSKSNPLKQQPIQSPSLISQRRQCFQTFSNTISKSKPSETFTKPTTPCANESTFIRRPQRKRIPYISDDDSSSDSSANESKIQKIKTPSPSTSQRKPRKPRRKRIKPNPFIENECTVSGDEKNNDSSDGSENGCVSQLISNTIIIDDEDGMHAKYLQSTRSRIGPGVFRIPEPKPLQEHRRFENIFSQNVFNESVSEYQEDSFMVNGDEDDIVSEGELSVLEQAELLLKFKRKQKREKRKNFDYKQPEKKRRKIIVPTDSSDDDTIEIN